VNGESCNSTTSDIVINSTIGVVQSKRPAVGTIRTFLTHHHWLAAGLVAAALLLKVLIPAGFMPGMANGMMMVQLCTGQGAQTVMMEIPGKAGDHDKGDDKRAEIPCAFSGLSAPTLAAADPVLLAVAISFIIATAFRAFSRPDLRRRVYLRPPLRGPPATA